MLLPEGEIPEEERRLFLEDEGSTLPEGEGRICKTPVP